MMLRPLRYLSEAKLSELRSTVDDNIARYEGGDFLDLERENGWAVESPQVLVDVKALAQLNDSSTAAKDDIGSSLLVYRAFTGMTPAVAREERVWTRLTHIDCFLYSRARWLAGNDGEDLRAAVAQHMFAPGLTGIRDDNAVSRLWWNMHIATIADPADPEGALRLIVKRADIRASFVERPGTAARRPLARAVVRAMRRDPWLTSTEEAFREFMRALNREGGGVLFEALTDAEADRVITNCAEHAHEQLGT